MAEGNSSMRGLVAGCLALVSAVLIVLTATPAHAHAYLVSTNPNDGAVVADAPGAIELRFNEPIEVPADGVRLFDRTGARVTLARMPAAPEVVAFGVNDLDNGPYVVTWRVVSDDGHPIAGTFTFAVGVDEVIDDALLAELAVDDDGVGAVVRVVRAVTYLALLVAVGVTWFIWWVARAPLDRRRLREVAVLSGITAAIATVVGFVAQAQSVTGRGVVEVLQAATVVEMLGTPFGQTAVVRLIWLIVAVVLIARGAPPGVSSVAMAVALGTFAFDGHQRTVEPMLLLAGADLVHLGVAAAWIGGIVSLLLLIRTQAISPQPMNLAGLVMRFSTVALVTMVILAASGVAMAWPLVRVPNALTATSYGVVLLVKLALVAWIVTIAAYNRWKLVPGIVAATNEARISPAGDAATGVQPDGSLAWTRLITTLKIEVGLVALVLGATAVLATTPPAATVMGATGMFVDEQPLTDDRLVELVVDPNRVGRNAIHLYVFDALGQPDGDATHAVVELLHLPTQTGPIRIEPFFAGPGHWVANIDDFVLPGAWQVDVVIGLDRFTEERARFTTTLVE